MSGVSGVGGVGGVGAAGGTGAVGGVSGASPVGGSSGSADGGSKTDSAEFVGAGQQPSGQHSHACQVMSTEDSLKLSQTIRQAPGADEGGLNLKKLIELLMAIKLMEAMGEQGNGTSVGNNLDIKA